ncbi:MAG: YybH family protein [Blastocatellia bacterium]
MQMQTKGFPGQPCCAQADSSRRVWQRRRRLLWVLPKLAAICVIVVGAIAAAPGESRRERITKLVVQIQRADYVRDILLPQITTAQKGGGSANHSLLEELVALERSALDRWITGDPQGYLDLYAPEVTYFDPTTERRVDGLEAMQALLAPIKNLKIPFKDPRYEMIRPQVQLHGEVALLSFNLVNYGKLPDQPETVLARWNSTEVYCRVNGKWKIIHSHWSFIKPELKQAGS